MSPLTLLLSYFITHCAAAAYLPSVSSLSDAPDPAPLNQDSSDYPCKSRMLHPNYFDKLSHMTVGSTQQHNTVTEFTLRPTPYATSGSCQISISLDAVPNRNSTFKVLRSILSGCPLHRPDEATPAKFPFFIPAEFPTDKLVTIALTWFSTNLEGIPAMHMECIPVYLEGSNENISESSSPSSSPSHMLAFDLLPDMFVANIGNGCTTPTWTNNIIFPDPGNDVAVGPTPGVHAGYPSGPGCQAVLPSSSTNSTIEHQRPQRLTGSCVGDTYNCLEGVMPTKDASTGTGLQRCRLYLEQTVRVGSRVDQNIRNPREAEGSQ
ncbi:hypothetical protein QBC42DRAFT_317203 [Cladorrhinum samala]|uniref:Ubiquitin 3 binding protein But2 C-terminal domain-containing protein n=1 Tax=Cladorrhinum samala TaxID=585594 RepID=A0AAV9HAR5_9PEZI|nr:hypothetical protein QBC42DRAFT_317203 [Cladorrhinum samala]